MIEFDVETQHLQWTHDEGAGLHLVAGLVQPEEGPELWAHPDDFEDAQSLMAFPDEGYRGWNTKFDLHVMKAAGYVLPPDETWHDGMVAAHIMDERTSVALKVRSAKLFGDEAQDGQKEVQAWLKEETKRRRAASKEDGTEYVEPNYSDVPLEIMGPYAKGDVELTRRTGDVYDGPIEANFKGLYALEMDTMRALFWAEDRGIPMDRKALVALEAELLDDIERLEAEAIKLSGFDNFNPRSPKQVSEALERLDADVSHVSRTATGQLKTDEENLLACDHPLAAAILAYRGQHKMYAMLRGILHTGSGDSKFPHPYLTSEDRVHPNFRQLGARTGRMSCSNPNFQQVPRDDLRLRYAVAAGEGKKLVCCDLDSIELRLLACFAGPGAFRTALVKEGADVHQQTADFLGLKGRRRSTGDIESPRAQGKRMNYLVVYGGGVNAIRKWFGLSQGEARRVLDRMHAAYPEVQRLQNRIEEALADRGYVRSPLTGRQYRMYGTGEFAVKKEGYKFLNYLIQGTAADVMKIALARVHDAGVPVVAVVHDEIIAEVDEADALEAAAIIEDSFTSFPELTEKSGVPITAEAAIVDHWSDIKEPGYVPDYAKE